MGFLLKETSTATTILQNYLNLKQQNINSNDFFELDANGQKSTYKPKYRQSKA